MGKGEIAHYEQFLLFPAVFSKDLYCRHEKIENESASRRLDHFPLTLYQFVDFGLFQNERVLQMANLNLTKTAEGF